jgi:hypothetical protein
MRPYKPNLFLCIHSAVSLFLCTLWESLSRCECEMNVRVGFKNMDGYVGRLIEVPGKCRLLKKLTCKETLHQSL